MADIPRVYGRFIDLFPRPIIRFACHTATILRRRLPMALVPFDDRDGWIWWDGALVPWRDAKLHVLSHGLHYASAVFEGERAYSGNIFRLRDHTDRLINSGRHPGLRDPLHRRADRRRLQRGAGRQQPDRRLCPPDRLARQRDAGGVRAAHQDPSGDRRLALAELFRRRPHEGHPARRSRRGSARRRRPRRPRPRRPAST